MDCDISSFKIQKIPELLFTHKLAGVNWANAHKNYDWGSVIFSDESSIWLNECNGKMWLKKRNQAMVLPLLIHGKYTFGQEFRFMARLASVFLMGY
jgi:hypothetical protein